MAQIDIRIITKIVSIIAACLLLTLCILTLVDIGKIGFSEVQVIIMTINYIIMAIILILSEFNLKIIERDFYLLAQLFGRGLYCVFLGLLLINEWDKFRLAVGIILCIVGVLYMIFYFTLSPQKSQANSNNESKVETPTSVNTTQ